MTDQQGLAKMGDAALKAVTLYALTHSTVFMSFGLGLIFSFFFEEDDPDSPFYLFVNQIPGWPVSVGLTFFLLGAFQFYFRLNSRRWRCSFWVYVAMGVITSVYGGLILWAALRDGTLVGPQFLYFGLAMSSTIHAMYVSQAIKIEKESGDHAGTTG